MPVLNSPPPAPPSEPKPVPAHGTSRPIWARLGSFSFRRRRLVVGLWFAALAVIFISGGAIGGSPDSTFEVPDSESRDGFNTLDAHFGGMSSGLSGTIVFHADRGVDDPAVAEAMSAMFAEVDEIKGVTITSPYAPTSDKQGFVSPDGRTAYARVDLAEDIDGFESSDIGAEIAELRPIVDGLRVEVGGYSLGEVAPPESELIGVAFAIVILIVAFGSVLAMGLPIGVAVFGVGAGIGITQLLTNVTTIPAFAPTIGAMIGLGVGIDYALFIVTRYREGLRAGQEPLAATITSINTAGRAVFFAGLTVVISLLGMFIMGLGFINGLAVAAVVTVLMTMIGSITLLPALIGFAQHRVERTRRRGLIAAGLIAVALLGAGVGAQPLLIGGPLAVVVLVASFAIAPLRKELPPRKEKPPSATWSYRWSQFVQRNPWPVVISVTTALLVLSIPVLSLRLGFSDESNYPEDTTTRQAYELLTAGFGPGTNGHLILTAEVSGPGDIESAQRLVTVLESTEGVAAVLGPIPNNTVDSAPTDAFIIEIVPETGPQDEATTELVTALRGDVIPSALARSDLDVNITGTVAANIDFSTYLGNRIPVFFAAVLTLSFLMLMIVFRSLLVPLKAIIMNMLSIGGAYGVIVAVFQWGWGVSILGSDAGPIEPFLPMMIFAIVFGLSMDYEVFLLSRIKEEYDRTGDPVDSVAGGLAATARVITAAAAIMVVVFGSFVLEDGRLIQIFGLGLAVAVLLDATLVRMLLVPATMELLGAKNWWLPRFLDRLLPTVNLDGHAEPIAVPEPDPKPIQDRVVV